MSFDKFREKFRRFKQKKPEEEDHVEYEQSSRKAKVYNPVEKVRQYKIKKQGYEELIDEEEEEPVQYVRTGKPKLIRLRDDGTVKRNAPPIPVFNIHDTRPRKIRIRADRTVKRRAPTPHKRSESDSDDLIDLHSQSSSSSSSSSSEDEDPFANWERYK